MSKYLSFTLPIIITIAVVGAVGFVFYRERTAQPSFPPPQGIAPQETGSLPQQQPGTQQQESGAPSTGGTTNPTSGFGQSQASSISVEATGAKYKIVSSKPTSGWFKTGQDADILLSGIGFNNTGGPLLFNHQGGIATDGRRLLLADRNNNRVLIWNKLPIGNTLPDLVLGQKDFITNNPGAEPDKMNWPVSVSVGGGKVAIADTNNNRILIWNNFPIKNGQAADLIINNGAISLQDNLKRNISWPWAVWTNGKKLVVTSTGSSAVLIWNTLPNQNDQPADIVLKATNKFGTPRSIASDGTNLMIGDHNAKPNNSNAGNFFWKTFPAKDDQPYDFFIASVNQRSQTPGEIFWGGAFTSGGKFITIGENLYIWNKFPQNATELPSMIIGSTNPSNSNSYRFNGGDGSDLALADNTLYISTCNGNKVVVYKYIPSTVTTKPDFAIGAPDINTNTLETNFIMSNPVPATDGKSLFVSSDFDNKLYVYKQLPDQPGAHPDYIYPFGGWSNALYGNTFAEVNSQLVFIWKTLPTNGQKPDYVLIGHIGNIQLQQVKGVAIDDKYFYLSDASANKVYIFEGIPMANSLPKYMLSVDQPYRLSSDGRYLVVTTTLSNSTGHVRIYKVNELSNDAQPLWMLQNNQVVTNLPQSAIVSNDSLFIADTGFNRILVWKKITDAIAGTKPDIILGKDNLDNIKPEIGQNKVFWPAGVAFDGSFLWVGEFKFSERLLRFSIKP